MKKSLYFINFNFSLKSLLINSSENVLCKTSKRFICSLILKADWIQINIKNNKYEIQ
jgi:hypothetical protein